jgi:hypothetical protein
MLDEYMNGCKNPKTLEVYHKITHIHHIHSYSMYVDEDVGEVVEIAFSMGGEDFHGQINPETGVVTLLMEYEVDVADGKKEPVVGLYGYAELDKLIEFLNKIPHINDVLIDTGGIRERVH